VNSENQLT